MALTGIYDVQYNTTEAQVDGPWNTVGSDPGVNVFEGDTIQGEWAFGPFKFPPRTINGYTANGDGSLVYWPSATILQYDNSVAVPTINYIELPYNGIYVVGYIWDFHVGALGTNVSWDSGNLTTLVKQNGTTIFTDVYTPGSGTAPPGSHFFARTTLGDTRQFTGAAGDQITLFIEDNIDVTYTDGDTRTPGLILDDTALAVMFVAETGGGSGYSGALLANKMTATALLKPANPQGAQLSSELMIANARLLEATTSPSPRTKYFMATLMGAN